MDKLLLNNFDEFRLFFNRHFKLSLNGKFRGVGATNWKLLAYRLYKYFNGRYPFSLVAKSQIMKFHIGKDCVKLYII